MLFVLFVVFIALVFDFVNGFHDAANSIATVVGTRVLTPRIAVIWAAFFNFVAAFAFETRVAKTIGKDIVDPAVVDPVLILAGLIGAIVWNLLTWWWGLPSSSSHALIGGFAGAAVMKAGVGVLVPHGLVKTLVFIVLSPLLGMVLGLHLHPLRHLALPQGPARAARPRLPEGPARFGRLVLVRARPQRRPEDHGDHRGAALLRGLPAACRDSVLDHPSLPRGHRPRDPHGRLADRPDDGDANHSARADRGFVRRVRRRRARSSAHRGQGSRSPRPTRSRAP